MSRNETPVGSARVSLSAGVGKPVEVTVNEPAVPTVKPALLALVIVGAAFTDRVKTWVALGSTLLLAVNDSP